MLESPISLIGISVFILIILQLIIFKNYRRCPSDKILVIYGKGTGGQSAKCVHGGAVFVCPILQDYQYLDLTPFSFNIELRGAFTKQNIRVDVPSTFTVAISTDGHTMQNAAERLLGLDLRTVQALASEIILGQLRLIVAQMDVEDFNTQHERFIEELCKNVDSELKKIGLKLLNVNINDILISDDQKFSKMVSTGNAQPQSSFSQEKLLVFQEQLATSQGEIQEEIRQLKEQLHTYNTTILEILDSICNSSTFEAAAKLRKAKEISSF